MALPVPCFLQSHQLPDCTCAAVCAGWLLCLRLTTPGMLLLAAVPAQHVLLVKARG